MKLVKTSTDAVPQGAKRTLLAAAVALVVLAASGVGYRIVASQLARPAESVPLPEGGLARMSMEIGDWTGRDVPLSQAIIRATGSDQVLNRSYARRGGMQTVGFYISYGVQARDLMPHRPEVCYPGGGWTMRDSRQEEIAVPGGKPLSCRVYQFDKTGMDGRPMTVLNYYIVDGQYSPDVSLLRSKAWRGQAGAHYMAQVQIVCSGGAGIAAGSSTEAVKAFAAASAVGVWNVLPPAGGGSADGPATRPAASQ